MKVLFINKFFYLKGGAEASFFETADLLKTKGHKIVFFSMKDSRNFSSKHEKYFVSNIDYKRNTLKNRIDISLKLLYSLEAKKKIEDLIRLEKPDIAHLKNIYHQISPSILHSLKKFNIPIVMTLADYKLVCASYCLFRRGRICELCKGGKYYWCFLTACVKNSRSKSLLNTLEMYFHHKILHIYDLVDIFTSQSSFLKNKVKEMGVIKGKIIHLPSFVSLEEFDPQHNWTENSIVYFGRLSIEKGLFTLIEAIKDIKSVLLKIIGTGPIEEELKKRAEKYKIKNIAFLGYKNRENLKNEIKNAMFTVTPSEWYENFPNSVMESFALGKSVVGARIGGMPEMIKDGETGLSFETGNPADLKEKILYLLNNPNKLIEMNKNARKFAEENLNPEKHYGQLMKIYQMAMEKHK